LLSSQISYFLQVFPHESHSPVDSSHLQVTFIIIGLFNRDDTVDHVTQQSKEPEHSGCDLKRDEYSSGEEAYLGEHIEVVKDPSEEVHESRDDVDQLTECVILLAPNQRDSSDLEDRFEEPEELSCLVYLAGSQKKGVASIVVN
jgi:hypothetical protein